MVSKSPNWCYSPCKWPKWLIDGGCYLLTNWDDPPSSSQPFDFREKSRKRRLRPPVPVRGLNESFFSSWETLGKIPAKNGLGRRELLGFFRFFFFNGEKR